MEDQIFESVRFNKKARTCTGFLFCFLLSQFETGFTDNYFVAFRECSIFLLYFIDNCKKLLGEIRIYFICFIDKYIYS